MEKSELREFLKNHAGRKPISFHMPGHKNGELFKRIGIPMEEVVRPDYDITEISGADNLFMPEEVLRHTMDKYKVLYESRESFLLINGSSAGILAGILASVPIGGKIIVARNCHKSVFNALELGQLQPIYVCPEKTRDYDISGQVTVDSVRRAFEEHPDARAIVLASPNYYGITSNIGEIAGIAHENEACVIVDEAHGAHLKFMAPDKAAENQGADIVVVSTHKTLGSFTQSGILNVYGNRVNIPKLASKLELIQSTSPSYLLMNSLDLNADIIKEHGKELFKEWRSCLDDFARTAIWIKGFMFMMDDSLDDTKINLDGTFLGLDGQRLSKELEERGILTELYDGPICMCMTGIGNGRNDYMKLLSALQDISGVYIDAALDREHAAEEKKAKEGEEISYIAQAALVAIEHDDKNALDEIERQLTVLFGEEEEDETPFDIMPWGKLMPAYELDWEMLSGSEEELVDLNEAGDRVAASVLAPYPPGVPLVAIGERISRDMAEFLSELRANGRKIAGLREDDKVMVYVKPKKIE